MFLFPNETQVKMDMDRDFPTLGGAPANDDKKAEEEPLEKSEEGTEKKEIKENVKEE